MKKLFKNAFKSFFSSKAGIILLSIIVFMTAGTFTLLTSTANTFKTSYNAVVQKGNLHDFTVKELYSVDGDIKFDAKLSNTPITPFLSKKTKGESIISGAEEYLNINSKDLSSIYLEKNSSHKSRFLRFKISDLKLIDSNNDGIIDKIEAPNSLKIGVMGKKGFKTDVKKVDYGWFVHPSKTPVSDPTYWHEFTFNSNADSIDIAKAGLFGQHDYKIVLKNRTNLLKEILQVIRTHKILKEGKKVIFKVEKSSGSFASLLPTTTTEVDLERRFLSKNNKYPIILNVNQNQINSLQSIIEIKKEFKDSIRKELVNERSKIFVSEIQKLYGENGKKGHQLDIQKVKSIELNSSQGARKVVSAIDASRKLDKMVLFDGKTIPKYMPNNSKIELPLSKTDLEKFIKIKKNGIPPKHIITDKGYKLSLTWKENFGIPGSASIIDPSSMMAIVSPSFATQNHIKYVDPDVILNLYTEAIKKHINESKYITENIKKNYKNSIVWVDKTPYFIIGSGTTPDFSYPIIGPDKPMPNTKKEAILFTNKNGYARVKDAFRASPSEDYLAFKFTKAAKNQDKILDQIEKIAYKDMSWGKAVNHIVSKTNDTSETVILAPQRISFLNKLQKNINTLSITLTVALIFFVTMVVGLVVKKQINSKKKNYGILMANGFSKRRIAFSNTIISLIIIIIPATLGYISGHFFQFILINVFKNTWTLPIVGDAFNWWSLLTTVGIPFVATIVIAYLISMWEMRGTIPEIISGSVSKISSAISARTIGAFKYIGIKTKASMSLFLTNISKMVLIVIATALAVVTISTSISTMHKFNDAKVASENSTRYSYKINFVSPTEEGGVIGAMKLEDIYNKNNLKQMFLNRDETSKTGEQAKPIFMSPMDKDKDWANGSKYLDNLVQFKSLLDIFAGLNLGNWISIGTNPWDVAEQLMPENQLNNANQHWKNFIQKNSKKYLNNNNYRKFIKYDKATKKYNIDPKSVYQLGNGVSDNYKSFLIAGINDAIIKYRKNKDVSDLPFFITYHNIILGDKDETYTSINTKLNLLNYKNNKNEKKMEITGVNYKTKYINLSDKAWLSLKNEKVKNVNGVKTIPIVINKYMQRYYKLNIGDTFPMKVTNSAKRFHNGPSGLIELKQRAKVVGIQNSYNDLKAFTLKKYANDSLEWKQTDKAFNGVFTYDKNPILFNSVPLYSLSGFYPGTDTIQKNGDIYNNIEKALPSLTKNNPAITKMDDYFKTYSNSPYVTFSNVNWSGADKFRFDNVSSISQATILFIESITIFLAIMFIIIISIMMIEDNKKFIATMKVLGYRDSEIRRIFFGSFLPSLLIGFLISAPIAFGLSLGITYAIMSFGSILVPLTLTWWTLSIAFSISMVGLLFVYHFSTRGFKNTSVLQAFNQ